jgi:phosphate transport system substrate-binding protein
MGYSGFICSSEEYVPAEIMKITKYILLALFILIVFGTSLLFEGCGSPSGKVHTDTPTSGVLYMAADDSYKPTVDAEVQVYQALYTSTAIHVKYESEDSLFSSLMHDSTGIIVAGRKLSKQEEAYFKERQLFPEQVKIATDAIALIVNNDNPDTMLTMDKIKAIFKNDSTWDAPGKGKITVVFDHENSSNSRYIRDSLIKGSSFPPYCFAVNSNPQVIDYVSKNKQAIGVIAVNWVSNDYDSATVGFLNKVKVVWVSATKDGKHYQPYQYYIGSGDYPLCRDVYIIKTEPYMGLGSGFLSFVASDRGQRIILREGILPATIPTHIISF